MNKFKDFDKYLSTTLKVYIFLLVIVFIMKLVGLDYFGLDVDNPAIVKIDNFANNFHLSNLLYVIYLYIYTYIFISICLKIKENMIINSLIVTLIGVLLKFYEGYVANTFLNCFIDFIYLLLAILIINNRKIKFTKIAKRYIFIFIVIVFYQLITLFIRNVNYQDSNSFILNFVLYLDYILLQLITYKVYFTKGVECKCGTVVGLFLHQLTLLKMLPKKLLTNFQNSVSDFKGKSKKDKITIAIFVPLVLLWNIFTVLVILAVAFLNDTVIECIFILCSFWITKTVFGKAFHLPNALQCFIVSNLTYYCLNRITAPIGISIIIPIGLGVALSYVTSKLVKNKIYKLYRGMPLDEFNETISKVTDNKLDIDMLRMFFVERLKDDHIAYQVSYSVDNVRKRRSAIVKKLRELK